MRKIIYALIGCLVVLIAGELALRAVLFRHVSYSNSESIDRQLHERNANPNWNILFIGDSETRWGINPQEVDSAFIASGIRARSFNHAFDGFGASWWPRLLPNLLAQPELKHVEVVVLGVQLIDSHRVVHASGEDCGDLQKPVLTSPFAKDLGVDSLCGNLTWDAQLAKRLFGGLWTVRYASSVRSLILPQFMQGQRQLKYNSRKDGEAIRGFEPHRSIAQDRDIFEDEFTRWKAQYKPDRDFLPLRQSEWPKLTASSGFFDQLHETVRSQGKTLVLFALPTNPLVIDTFKRRADYLRHSRLLQAWAEARGVVFVDAGIQDVADPDTYFSDMRHLSGEGARQYSQKLGQMLAQRGVLRTHTTNALNTEGGFQ